MNFESRRQPVERVGFEPEPRLEAAALLRINGQFEVRCSDSTVPRVNEGLGLEPKVRDIQSSLNLNERGPALIVFWSRGGGMGAGQMEDTLAKTGTSDHKTVAQKTEPEGAGLSLSPPLLSVRKWASPD